MKLDVKKGLRLRRLEVALKKNLKKRKKLNNKIKKKI
jgi:hypothetical protein